MTPFEKILALLVSLTLMYDAAGIKAVLALLLFGFYISDCLEDRKKKND